MCRNLEALKRLPISVWWDQQGEERAQGMQAGRREPMMTFDAGWKMHRGISKVRRSNVARWLSQADRLIIQVTQPCWTEIDLVKRYTVVLH